MSNDHDVTPELQAYCSDLVDYAAELAPEPVHSHKFGYYDAAGVVQHGERPCTDPDCPGEPVPAPVAASQRTVELPEMDAGEACLFLVVGSKAVSATFSVIETRSLLKRPAVVGGKAVELLAAGLNGLQ